MPAMLRPKGKIQKIVENIMGKPQNMQGNQKPFNAKIRALIRTTRQSYVR